MAKNKVRLGKGLSALIPNEPKESENKADGIAKKSLMIDPRLVKTNPYQPRLSFDKQALAELKQSIEENGLIQPIAVRKMGDAYELIAGERRLRCVLDLGYGEIPAHLLEIESKEEMLEIALIENVQREKLNIIELAKSYRQLVEECNLTIETVARKIGKERSTINNILRLLKLPKFTQDKLIKNQMSMGHARALLGLNNASKINQLAEDIVSKELSVRKVEQLVRFENDQQEAKKTKQIEEKKNPKQAFYSKVENTIRQCLGTKVRLKTKKTGGVIEVEYFNDDDLNRLKERFEEMS